MSAATGQTKSNLRGFAGGHRQLVKRAGFGAIGIRADRGLVAVNNEFVKGVLEMADRLALAEKPADIGFVVAKQNLRRAVAIQSVIAQFGMSRQNGSAPGAA